MHYLLTYPHGCVEQTTSRAFPQLYLGSLVDMTDQEEERARQNVDAAITRLMQMQISSGGFGYWPGSNTSSDWGSSYAGHFLLEAEREGYDIPSGFKDRWIRYQKQAAASFEMPNQKNLRNLGLAQAYRLYTLALAGKPEVGSMNRLNSTEEISPRAKWMLASAYAQMGQKQEAEKLIAGLSTQVEEYRELDYTYGSSLRDRALILMTYTDLGNTTKSLELTKVIAKRLNTTRWLSTQEVSFSLMAISRYQKSVGGADALQVEYEVGAQKGSISGGKGMYVVKLTDPEKAGDIQIKNNSGGAVFVNVIRRGVPEVSEEISESNNLIMKVSYLDADGYPLDVSSLKQGSDFIAEVTVNNPGHLDHYQNLVLSQVFPSGWEIRNQRIEGMEGQFASDEPDYQDIRDDRVYSYFNLRRNAVKTFRIKLNAAYLGKFYLPATSCEAMYSEDIYAREKGQWVEVVSGDELAQ
ncbi:hypothetical protein KFE98_04995 [bacterium SCSIO 12741]|nr:hypothetical protein KFE98_04995 [bacterium SCSIO 12741]